MSPPQFVITIYCDEPSHTKTPVGRYLMSNPLDVHTKLGQSAGAYVIDDVELGHNR